MLVKQFMQLLPLLPVHESTAQTVRKIAQRFFRLEVHQDPEPNQIRMLQKYLNELSDPAQTPNAPLERIADPYPPRFYLKNERLVKWFMTEEIALNLLLARSALNTAIGDDGSFAVDTLQESASALVQKSDATRRLWQRVRVARDGIGRLAPTVDNQVIRALLQAVMQDRQVRFSYTNAAGHPSQPTVSIQGIVMKDGTLYVLGTKEFTDSPRHYAAHRIQDAEVLLSKPILARKGFDLDTYIEGEYQLSHVLNKSEPLLELQLRVRKDYLYHFIERPMTKEQTIEADTAKPGWSFVSARIPRTYILVEFLQSMGAGLEVLAPADIRAEMAEALQSAASYYSETPTR